MGYPSPLKNTHNLLHKPPPPLNPLNLQTVQASPLFRQFHPIYWFFVNAQIKFLVMTEKNIFVYKLFLSTKILDISLFFT